MSDLRVIRDEIDGIDNEILQLFEKRMEVAKKVADFKRGTGKKVFDPKREEEKLQHLESSAHSEFNKGAVRELFCQIMSISRKYQYHLLMDQENVTDFCEVDRLPLEKDEKVAFYGAYGSYTQQAMEQFFGDEVQGESCKTFIDVMEQIASGQCIYGVLPIENSSTGGITDNYDLLLEYKNCIVGEQIIKIEQCLLGVPGASIEKLQKVYSHQQGLLQCGDFLRKHPYIQPLEYSSTAECAKKIAQENNPYHGAIASRQAAKEYGLTILGDSIQKEKENRTRFIIISKNAIYEKESDKLALCIELPHESGSLYRILSHFMYNHLNLTKIESRPIPGRPWEYRFFIDIEGNLKSSSVKNALYSIREEVAYLRVIGNFKSEM